MSRLPQLTYEQCHRYFDLPVAQAATRLGVSRPTISKVLRARGIKRWPYRKLKAQGRLEEWRLMREASIHQQQHQDSDKENHHSEQNQLENIQHMYDHLQVEQHQQQHQSDEQTFVFNMEHDEQQHDLVPLHPSNHSISLPIAQVTTTTETTTTRSNSIPSQKVTIGQPEWSRGIFTDNAQGDFMFTFFGMNQDTPASQSHLADQGDNDDDAENVEYPDLANITSSLSISEADLYQALGTQENDNIQQMLE